MNAYNLELGYAALGRELARRPRAGTGRCISAGGSAPACPAERSIATPFRDGKDRRTRPDRRRLDLE